METSSTTKSNLQIEKPMTAHQKLENCLTKAISEFKVREMLTKFGISEDAEITLEIQSSESSEALASCSVPTAAKHQQQISDASIESISLRSLQSSLIDNFINPAIKTFDLSRLIADVDGSTEDDENKLIIHLSSQDSNSNLNFSVAACCAIVGCGKCCQYRQC